MPKSRERYFVGGDAYAMNLHEDEPSKSQSLKFQTERRMQDD
jgi:hypothetical protein